MAAGTMADGFMGCRTWGLVLLSAVLLSLLGSFPRCSAVTTAYCSNPPRLAHGRPSQRDGRGILGYPVGSFAYYDCEPSYKVKDGVELFRSCEYNGERAVWSDVSSECVPGPALGDADNGPTWNMQVGTHYAPPALNQRSRKIRMKVPPELQFGSSKEEKTGGRSGPYGDETDTVDELSSASDGGESMDGVGLFGNAPPDPILSKYRYGCGVAPIVPNASPSRPPQRRYSVGSKIAYRCFSGKAPTVPEHQMQTMCIYDDGYAHWTPLDAQCIGDSSDVDSSEEEQDAIVPATTARQLKGWRMASMQQPGFLTVEKELEVPPIPSPERNVNTARISFAEPAPGGDDKRSQYPWPLSIFADEANPQYHHLTSDAPVNGQPSMSSKNSMLSPENDSSERDRIIVSKTLFLQPPPFPNPPFRVGGAVSKKESQRRASMCDSVFTHGDPPYNPQTCRKPPSQQEIATRAAMYANTYGSNDQVDVHDDIEQDDLINAYQYVEAALDQAGSNMGGYCLGPPPSVPSAVVADPALRRVLYPSGAQVEYMCKPGYAFDNGVSVRTSCFVPVGANDRKGRWNPIIGRCVPNVADPVQSSMAADVSDENDIGFMRRRYGGHRNPEEISRPLVVPGVPHRSMSLVPNDNALNRQEVLSSTAPQRDARNCVGDECLPGAGPEELEAATLPEEVNYQVPSEFTKTGKLALNIIHDNDRRTFSASEGVMRGLVDTGFPFNEMYRQQKLFKNKSAASDKPARPPIESRAYAMSERLMRGGLHGPTSDRSGMEPQVIVSMVLGVIGVLGLAFLACKCIKGCSSLMSDGLCGDVDDEQCDEDGEGGGMSDTADDVGDDGMVFQRGSSSHKPFRIPGRRWRTSNRRLVERLEDSDGGYY